MNGFYVGDDRIVIWGYAERDDTDFLLYQSRTGTRCLSLHAL